MKTVSTNLSVHLAQDTTTLARLLSIKRQDGQGFYYTDFDRNILFRESPAQPVAQALGIGTGVALATTPAMSTIGATLMVATIQTYYAYDYYTDWSSATAYGVNAQASYLGRPYVCIVANTNHLPTDPAYWATSFSDSLNNTWTFLNSSNQGADFQSTIYYCENPITGPSHTASFVDPEGGGGYPIISLSAWNCTSEYAPGSWQLQPTDPSVPGLLVVPPTTALSRVINEGSGAALYLGTVAQSGVNF